MWHSICLPTPGFGAHMGCRVRDCREWELGGHHSNFAQTLGTPTIVVECQKP